MAAKTTIAAVLLAAIATSADADEAEIVGAELRLISETYTVSVTIRHGDTGWEDYADGWRVELADGTVLGTRVLVHPHVNEQPFTRSLSGVAIPDGEAEVFIRARTLTEGWGETVFPVPVGQSG